MNHEPNITYIKKLSGEDTFFEKKFIKILKDEFPEERGVYEKAYESKDHAAVAEIVHKLKHKFNILGMHKAYELAVSYEEEVKKENYGHSLQFSIVLDVVESFLKTI